MGCYDIVRVPCPRCGTKAEAQSKSGQCELVEYELYNAPQIVLEDVNRHAPFTCNECGMPFAVTREFKSTPFL